MSVTMSDDTVCCILTVSISATFPRGSLVTPIDKDRQIYKLHSAGGKENTFTCSEEDVAPVFADDYPYLCRITDPSKRYEVFMSPHKLKWAKGIKPGDRARAKLRKKDKEKEEYVAVEVRWVGNTKIGIKFGVEIIDPLYRGQGDASVNNYFTCAEKCGMLLDLDSLECDKLLHPNFDTNLLTVPIPGRIKDRASKSPARISEREVRSKSPARINEREAKSPVGERNGDVERLRKENKQFREELKKEKADAKAKLDEAEKQIESLRSQNQREMNFHQEELQQTADQSNDQIKQLMDSEQHLRDELVKKAEHHAAELQEVIEHHKRELKEKERQHLDVVRELNKHFQDEIKALQHQWDRSIANTWEVDRDDVKLSNTVIGQGKLGVVVKGHFRGIEVAVKKFHSDLVSEDNEKLIRWEINLLAQIRHPNLLLFLGGVVSFGSVVSLTGESTLIVTELLSTSLRTAYRNNEVSDQSKLPILRDVASALQYIHTNRVPLVHRLLNSSRVLLEEVGGVSQWKAKLSVFSMVNALPNALVSEDDAYAAPEIVSRSNRYQTDKVDVYSFGVLICEVTLCRSPPSKREDLPVMLSDVYAKDIELFHLAKNCMKQLHEDRPSMSEVRLQLK